VLFTDIPITQSVIASLIILWAAPIIVWLAVVLWLVVKRPARRARDASIDGFWWLVGWCDEASGMKWLRYAVYGVLYLPLVLWYGKKKLAKALRNYLNQRYELRRILARPVIAGLQLLRRVLEEAARWAQGAQEQEQLWQHWVEGS
jgi:hypothetical protein